MPLPAAFDYRLELGAFAVQPDDVPPGPDAPPNTILLGSLQLRLNYCVERLLEGETVREPKLAFLRSVDGRERRMGQIEVAMRLITAPRAAAASIFHVYVHDVAGTGAGQSFAVEASVLSPDAQRAMEAAEKDAAAARSMRLELQPPAHESEGSADAALWHALATPSRTREVDSGADGARWDEVLSVPAAGPDDALRIDVCDAAAGDGAGWASLGGASLHISDAAPGRPTHVYIPLRGDSGPALRATVVRAPSLREEVEGASASGASGEPWRAEIAVGGIAASLSPPPHRMGVRVSLCSEEQAAEAVRAFPEGASAPDKEFQLLAAKTRLKACVTAAAAAADGGASGALPKPSHSPSLTHPDAPVPPEGTTLPVSLCRPCPAPPTAARPWRQRGRRGCTRACAGPAGSRCVPYGGGGGR